MSNRDSMIFYRSFFESGMLLKPKDRTLLFEAILKYQFTGEKTPLPDAAMATWILIEPVLDSNNRRYENGYKGKAYGAKGGRPPNKNNPIGDIKAEETITPNKEVVEDVVEDVVEEEEEEAKKSSKLPSRKKYGEYKNVLLNDEDYGKLQTEFPSDWNERVERLSEYIAAKGDKYKNHLAVIRSWARKDGTRPNNSPVMSDGKGGCPY